MSDKQSKLQETIAAVVSGAIVLGAIIYWIVQISGVMEMMRLANG